MIHFLSSSRKNRPDFAIDLGTANTRVIMRDDGVVFDEPSLCCFSSDVGHPRLMAAGRDVAEMVDRVPSALQIRRPLARGVLQDLEAASALLDYALTSVGGTKGMRRPRAMIGIPADATKAEASALRTSAQDAGFGKIELVREPFAAALGADLSLDDAQASMIIECGAGTTEIAVYSLGGLCLSRSVRQGGLALDEALTEFLHSKHHFLIGSQTAEQLKRELARHLKLDDIENETIAVKGRDARKGRPDTLTLPAIDFQPVFEKHIAPLVDAARGVLSELSPDLAADLIAGEIVMTGGSACVELFAKNLSQESGVNVRVAKAESRCVARGLERLLGN
jgi:rod shape-determining protein MreB and related proteins